MREKIKLNDIAHERGNEKEILTAGIHGVF